jgi:hypothetical protein
MKVRILKASEPTYWYANSIGKEYEVEGPRKGEYILVPFDTNGDHYILEDDCEVVSGG